MLWLITVDVFYLQSGKLQIFDIGSGTLLEDIEAHAGAVWSICMSPDKVGASQVLMSVRNQYK